MPRSTAATRYLVVVPGGGLTVYGWGVVTILARSAPVIPGLASTRPRSRSGSSSTVDTAARMAPLLADPHGQRAGARHRDAWDPRARSVPRPGRGGRASSRRASAGSRTT